jgi:hypothetical protein
MSASCVPCGALASCSGRRRSGQLKRTNAEYVAASEPSPQITGAAYLSFVAGFARRWVEPVTKDWPQLPSLSERALAHRVSAAWQPRAQAGRTGSTT